MKFSLSKEEMITAIEKTIKQLEAELILRLSAGGIDFEIFNPETFEYNEDSAVHMGIKLLVEKINNINLKLDNLKQSDS